MLQSSESAVAVKNSIRSATPFSRLTKAQLLEILQGGVGSPLTLDDVYRCAMSIAVRFCRNRIVERRNVDPMMVAHDLSALVSIYLNR